MSTVAVFGTTGYVGGHITDELLDRGHQVIGIARHTDSLSLHPRAGLTPKPGSLFDATFVEDVVAGVDAVVIALRAGAEPPLLDAVPTLLETLGGTGIRLGIVGGAGSLLVEPGGKRVFDDESFPEAAIGEATGSFKVLTALRESDADVDWFYLSPAIEFGSWVPGERTGSYRVSDEVAIKDADGKSYISGADYAIAFVDEIEKPAHHKARFAVAY